MIGNKALLGLGIFKNVTIQFLKSKNYSNKLDCYIICNPLIKQSITAETEGINTSGNLGVDGSLVYQNKNFFKYSLKLSPDIPDDSKMRLSIWQQGKKELEEHLSLKVKESS